MSRRHSFAVTITIFFAAHGHATWTVTKLGLPNLPTVLTAMVPSERVGEVDGHACAWTGLFNTMVNLHPGGRYSAAYATSGALQGGKVEMLNGVSHASIWAGSAASWIDLEPAGTSDSSVTGILSGKQVGWSRVGAAYRAGFWTGAPGSWVDITPADHAEGLVAGAVGETIVGRVQDGDLERAYMWVGPLATGIDLHPLTTHDSGLFATDGLRQVGFTVSNNSTHAGLWSGTPGSYVDLHPSASMADSWARGVSGSTQCGTVYQGQRYNACIWSGTASSYIDLTSTLPADANGSQANCIYSDGVNTYVGGIYWGPNGSEAIIWSQPIRRIRGHVNFGGGRKLSTFQVQLRRFANESNIGAPLIVPVDEEGNYVCEVRDPANYYLTLKPAGYLRRTLHVDLTNADMNNLEINLIPGNIVPDASVDLSDYTILLRYFNKISTDSDWSTPGTTGYRPSDADIDGNNVVDLSDYTLLLLNFNAVGDH